MVKRWLVLASLVLGLVSLGGCGGGHGLPASTATTSTTFAEVPPTPFTTTTLSVASPWKLSLSSPSWAVDGTVTLHGTDCPGATSIDAQVGNGPKPSPQTPPLPKETLPAPTGPLQTESNGVWSQVFKIPEGIVGRAWLSVVCDENGAPTTLGALEVSYPALAVSIATPFQLQVTPSNSVAWGSSLTVSSIGGGCPPNFVPVVDLEDPTYLFPDVALHPDTYAQFVSGSSWTAILPITGLGAHAGQFDVVARCYFGLGVASRMYEPVPITVVGGPSPSPGGTPTSTTTLPLGVR